jgi:hypothetical protein
MTPLRTVALLFALAPLCLPGPLRAQAKKQTVTQVTQDDLGSEAADRYVGKLVCLEATAPGNVRRRELGGKPYYAMVLGGKTPVYVWCPGEPDFAAGDRLRITGQFDLDAPSFVRLRIKVGVPGGKVERLPAKQGRP